MDRNGTKLPQAPQPRSHTTLSASATPPLFAASWLHGQRFFKSRLYLPKEPTPSDNPLYKMSNL